MGDGRIWPMLEAEKKETGGVGGAVPVVTMVLDGTEELFVCQEVWVVLT